MNMKKKAKKQKLDRKIITPKQAKASHSRNFYKVITHVNKVIKSGRRDFLISSTDIPDGFANMVVKALKKAKWIVEATAYTIKIRST